MLWLSCSLVVFSLVFRSWMPARDFIAMRPLFFLFNLSVNFMYAHGTIQIIYPTAGSIVGPGTVELQFYDDVSPPRIADLSTAFTLLWYTGDNEQPISLGYKGISNFSTDSGLAMVQVYDFGIDSRLFNGTNVFFLGVITGFRTNTSIQMTTFSERFSLVNMTGTADQTTLTINKQVSGQPSPGRVFRCNVPGLAFCPSSVALAGFVAPTQSSSKPQSTVSSSLKMTPASISSSGSSPMTATVSTTQTLAPTSTAAASPPPPPKSQDTGLIAGLASGLAAVVISIVSVTIYLCCRGREKGTAGTTWWHKAPSTPDRTSELPTGAGPYLTAELPVAEDQESVVAIEHKPVVLQYARIVDVWDGLAEQRALDTPEQIHAETVDGVKVQEKVPFLPVIKKAKSL